MIDIPIDLLRDELPLASQTCRYQHQTWSAKLTGDEQEIDQLLTLLAELPNGLSGTHRNLQPYTIAYSEVLNRLKVRINRLRFDAVCSGSGCSSIRPATFCPDPRFVLPTMTNPLISGISTEFSRIKDRCDLFFGELMMLNLI